MGQHREPDPHHSSVDREPAQPTPHRRHRQPQHLRHPPMPRTRRLRNQRRADHLDPITPTEQTVSADQHMRDRARRAPRATSTMPQHDLTATQNPPPRPPPRIQTTSTIRASQLASQQSAFDFQRIRSYNLQQCPRASGRTLPSPAKVRPGGFLRVQNETLSHKRKQGSHRLPHNHHPRPRCRYNTRASSTSTAINTPGPAPAVSATTWPEGPPLDDRAKAAGQWIKSAWSSVHRCTDYRDARVQAGSRSPSRDLCRPYLTNAFGVPDTEAACREAQQMGRRV